MVKQFGARKYYDLTNNKCLFSNPAAKCSFEVWY